MAVQAFLYDDDGDDRPVSFDRSAFLHLTERQLLWIDISPADEDALEKCVSWLSLPMSVGGMWGGSTPQLRSFGGFLCLSLESLPLSGIEGESVGALNLMVGPNWIVTVHEETLDLLISFQRQVQEDRHLGALRGADVLMTLLSGHLTGFFRAMDVVEAEVEVWDSAATSLEPGSKENPLIELRELRARVARVRRVLAPHRDVYSALLRPDIQAALGASERPPDFGALAQQFDRAVSAVDRGRDLVISAVELYLATISQQTNLTVQTLTVVTVMLLPISTLAGILGMNFPARFFKNGDPGFWITLGVMVALSGSIARYALSRGWLRLHRG